MAEKWRPQTMADEVVQPKAMRVMSEGADPEPVPAPDVARCPGLPERPCGRTVPLDHMVRVSGYPPECRPATGEHLCSACRKWLQRARRMTVEEQAAAHGAPPEIRARARAADDAISERRTRVAARRERR